MSAAETMTLLAVPRIVETVAVACYNDTDAREIADKENLVDYEDADAETQQFWRFIARAALEASAHAELIEALQQFVNGVRTHMLDSPADDILANVTARSECALAKARGEQ